jgi:hypothetical protein
VEGRGCQPHYFDMNERAEAKVAAFFGWSELSWSILVSSYPRSSDAPFVWLY